MTQPGAGLVLALTGPEPGELAPPELEMLSRSLMGTLLKLARERDLGDSSVLWSCQETSWPLPVPHSLSVWNVLPTSYGMAISCVCFSP